MKLSGFKRPYRMRSVNNNEFLLRADSDKRCRHDNEHANQTVATEEPTSYRGDRARDPESKHCAARDAGGPFGD